MNLLFVYTGNSICLNHNTFFWPSTIIKIHKPETFGLMLGQNYNFRVLYLHRIKISFNLDAHLIWVATNVTDLPSWLMYILWADFTTIYQTCFRWRKYPNSQVNPYQNQLGPQITLLNRNYGNASEYCDNKIIIHSSNVTLIGID